MKPTLRVGDVVELNSGGPRMVIELIEHDRAFCRWPNKTGTAWFPLVCLKRHRRAEWLS